MKGLLTTLASMFARKPPPPVEGPFIDITPVNGDGPIMLSEHDMAIIVRTLYGEARGEPFDGQVAVAHVIRNRAKRKGTSMAYECLRPRQFSCWNNDPENRANLRAMETLFPGNWQYISMSNILMHALEKKDTTDGALHYHATSVSPKWAKDPNAKVTKRIGNHIFYKGVAW